jgi:hypothetical protein
MNIAEYQPYFKMPNLLTITAIDRYQAANAEPVLLLHDHSLLIT